jgi:hypothetical protein
MENNKNGKGKNKKCVVIECDKQAIYNLSSESGSVYCLMVNVIK